MFKATDLPSVLPLLDLFINGDTDSICNINSCSNHGNGNLIFKLGNSFICNAIAAIKRILFQK